MTKRLWGENYFDPSTQRWRPSPTGSTSCKRGFVLYVYDSIKKILNSSIHDHKDRLLLMMQKLGHKEMNLHDLKGKELFEHIMQIWLPISHIICEDPTSLNSEGLSSKLGHLVDSRRTREDVDAISKSYKKGHEALAEKNPTGFCLMPKGSVNRRFSLPPDVLERLAPYQIEAVQWLWDLHCESKGGIFADDMGMGKTRTVCSFLRGLLHSQLIKRAIIVAPKTILSQWEVELGKVGLAEQTKMYRIPLSQRESLNDVIRQGGLLLTSYEVFRSKHRLLTCEGTKMIEWNYIFLDEGHRIKNEETQTSQAFSTLKCAHKIVITGTPFQNNLKELYVLVDFCCPNLLGNEEEFFEKFGDPIERAKYADSQLGHKRLSMSASKGLKELLKPHMLRRTKRLLQAMGLLGNKYEMTVWLEMTDVQIKLYRALLTEVQLDKSDGVSFAKAAVAKNICNHPSILRRTDSGDVMVSLNAQGPANNYKQQLLELVSFPESTIGSSCKIKFIMYLVKKLLTQKHKILVFSQSVPMLELVEKALLKMMNESKIIRMHGTTPQPERDAKIKKFQANIEKPKEISPEDVPDVFLMTTSVGGMGLNLTAASRVITVDPAQNPSMDNQSVDRAFRFGQKKDVIVYRLITSGTIEEHTYRQQVIKGEVSTSVTEREQCARTLEEETGRVLSLPKGGFDVSLTLKELGDHGFDMSISEHVEFVARHKVVVGINNHGSLFSIEESLPLPREDDSPVKVGRCSRKKISRDIVIDGEKHDSNLNDTEWGFRNEMLTGGAPGGYTMRKPLPQKLYRCEISGSSRTEAGQGYSGDDPPKGRDAPKGPG